jgi:hypothetical protein
MPCDRGSIKIIPPGQTKSVMQIRAQDQKNKFSLVKVFIVKMPGWTSLIYPVSIMFQPFPFVPIESRQASQCQYLQHFEVNFQLTIAGRAAGSDPAGRVTRTKMPPLTRAPKHPDAQRVDRIQPETYSLF